MRGGERRGGVKLSGAAGRRAHETDKRGSGGGRGRAEDKYSNFSASDLVGKLHLRFIFLRELCIFQMTSHVQKYKNLSEPQIGSKAS